MTISAASRCYFCKKTQKELGCSLVNRIKTLTLRDGSSLTYCTKCSDKGMIEPKNLNKIERELNHEQK